MINQYYILERGKVCIKLESRLFGNHTVMIDEEDLPKVQLITGRWYIMEHHMGLLYVRANDARRRQPLLHRVIMNPQRGYNTCFLTDDTFNCCKSNLINLPIGKSPRQYKTAKI